MTGERTLHEIPRPEIGKPALYIQSGTTELSGDFAFVLRNDETPTTEQNLPGPSVAKAFFNDASRVLGDLMYPDSALAKSVEQAIHSNEAFQKGVTKAGPVVNAFIMAQTLVLQEDERRAHKMVKVPEDTIPFKVDERKAAITKLNLENYETNPDDFNNIFKAGINTSPFDEEKYYWDLSREKDELGPADILENIIATHPNINAKSGGYRLPDLNEEGQVTKAKISEKFIIAIKDHRLAPLTPGVISLEDKKSLWDQTQPKPPEPIKPPETPPAAVTPPQRPMYEEPTLPKASTRRSRATMPWERGIYAPREESLPSVLNFPHLERVDIKLAATRTRNSNEIPLSSPVWISEDIFPKKFDNDEIRKSIGLILAAGNLGDDIKPILKNIFSYTNVESVNAENVNDLLYVFVALQKYASLNHEYTLPTDISLDLVTNPRIVQIAGAWDSDLNLTFCQKTINATCVYLSEKRSDIYKRIPLDPQELLPVSTIVKAMDYTGKITDGWIITDISPSQEVSLVCLAKDNTGKYVFKQMTQPLAAVLCDNQFDHKRINLTLEQNLVDDLLHHRTFGNSYINLDLDSIRNEYDQPAKSNYSSRNDNRFFDPNN